MTDHETLIIGGGQAGLAAARQLKLSGSDVTILEARREAGGSWPDYYDSLKLFSPARYSALPGLLIGGDPERYPTRDEISGYLKAYAKQLPVRFEGGQRVDSVAFKNGRFVLSLGNGSRRTAKKLIVASGGFGTPVQPEIEAQESFAGRILHAAAYKNPKSFARQRVVVVGSGNSAVQIAVELAQHADVSLAVRRPVKFFPQRILGRSLHWWYDKLALNGSRILSGHGDGVLDDGVYRAALRRLNPPVTPMFSRFTVNGVAWDDGSRERVDAVIFATGYRPSLDFLKDTGALGVHGLPYHRRGVSSVLPGLAFVGLPGQSGLASATLRGVAPDAAYVVRKLGAPAPRRAFSSGRPDWSAEYPVPSFRA